MDHKNISTISTKKNKQKQWNTPPIALTGLEPYTGTWDFEQAAHLLRRATFGATYEQIQDAVEDGLETTVTQLLADYPMPTPPINYYQEEDSVPIGGSWINETYPELDNLNPVLASRRYSLLGWTYKQISNTFQLSIRNKLTLFWHNHFATEENVVKDAKFRYRYITLLMTNGLGNFRQLVKDITIDPTMLRYLDGRANTKNKPNENYARELLELFTIGKGPQVGPGDYTNYTEDDVVAIAKVLTGWRDYGYHSKTIGEIYSGFIANNHDTSDKQLSPRFDDAIIQDAGDQEYINLIDLIFQKEQVAVHICKKLYRWFVNYDITDDVEADVIQPMVQNLLENDYEIKPVIELLLKSEHFYDVSIRGAIIKNPIEFAFSILRIFEVELPADPADWYHQLRKLDQNLLSLLDMQYYEPPSVAGWRAYYIEPQFYQTWINSVTLGPRMYFSNKIAQDGISFGGHQMQIDVLPLVAKLNDPYNANSVINELSLLLFPEPILQEQKDALKDILIPGLPDDEWTIEYSNHLSDPANEDLAKAVANRIRDLIQAMLSMPEFYLS